MFTGSMQELVMQLHLRGRNFLLCQNKKEKKSQIKVTVQKGRKKNLKNTQGAEIKQEHQQTRSLFHVKMISQKRKPLKQKRKLLATKSKAEL